MKQTIRELAALIDTEGQYNVSADMWIRVRVEDVRMAYGDVQLQITPVAGTGYIWVKASNVKAG